jgi:hypothetical protein
MKNNAIKFKNKREHDSEVANKALDKVYGFEFGKVNVDAYLAERDARNSTGYSFVDEDGNKHDVSKNEYDRLCAFHGL